jgi:hypothetical protein
MPRRHTRSLALAGAALAAAAALPLTAAAAGLPNISVWSGKTKQHKERITMYQESPGKAVYLSFSVSCPDASGTAQDTTMALHALPKKGKLTAKTTKGLGTAGGTMSISTTTVAKHAAVGRISWELPASLGGCKGSDTFQLKYSVSHGG